MSAADLRSMGYEPSRGGWLLVDPDARPPKRPGLCRACFKFEAWADGWCAGCVYFGPGDPHGVRQHLQDPLERFDAQLREIAEGDQ